MPRLSAVGISSLQAGEDVNWKDSALPVELEPHNLKTIDEHDGI